MRVIRLLVLALVVLLSLEFAYSVLWRLFDWQLGNAQYQQSGWPFWFYGAITLLQASLAVTVWFRRWRPVALLVLIVVMAAAIFKHQPINVYMWRTFGLPLLNILLAVTILVSDWYLRKAAVLPNVKQ